MNKIANPKFDIAKMTNVFIYAKRNNELISQIAEEIIIADYPCDQKTHTTYNPKGKL
jgi:hypothetical protein